MPFFETLGQSVRSFFKHFVFFTNKTIPKLVNASGNVITDQNQTLQEAETYYENLYSKRDTVSNINLKNEIPYTGIPTLSDEIKNNLEGEITYAELTASIKRMKKVLVQMVLLVNSLNSFGIIWEIFFFGL